MAKLRTTQKINWGGNNPFIKNFLEIEIKEVSRTNTEIIFNVIDTIIGEKTEIDITYEFNYLTARNVNFTVSVELFNQLYAYIETQMPTNLTPFEKEALRPKLAFLYYFTNDKILDENDVEYCLYGTQPEDWQMI